MIRCTNLRASAYCTLAILLLSAAATGAGGGSSGKTWTTPKDGSEMVSVPADSVKMGSNEQDDEKPIHDVSVGSFGVRRQRRRFGFCGAALANRNPRANSKAPSPLRSAGALHRAAHATCHSCFGGRHLCLNLRPPGPTLPRITCRSAARTSSRPAPT